MDVSHRADLISSIGIRWILVEKHCLRLDWKSFSAVKGVTVTRTLHTNLSAPWSKIIPLWRFSMAVLNWHGFNVATNVTFITSFLFYSSVSSDLQRRRERERGRFCCDLVVLHIRCSVLAAGSSIFLLWIFFLLFWFCSCLPGRFAVQRAQFCRGSKTQAYFHCMHSASVNTFCRSSHITKACCRLGYYCVVGLVKNSCLCVCIVSVHTCLSVHVSIKDPGAANFGPIQKF